MTQLKLWWCETCNAVVGVGDNPPIEEVNKHVGHNVTLFEVEETTAESDVPDEQSQSR
jgi:hypothetical protein